MTADDTISRFRTTRWSMIDDLASDDEDRRRRALDALAQIYWPAIYAYLRRLGHDPATAADLTQDFFGTVVCGRNLLATANRNRARLRTLLRAAVKHFSIDHGRRASTKLARRELPLEQLEREEQRLAQDTGAPDESFDVRWAGALLEETLRRGEAHFRERDKAAHWQAFQACVVRPSVDGTEPPSHRDLAEQLGFDSAAAVAAAVHVVRKRQLAILRSVIAETVSDPSDTETEFNELKDLLG